MRPEDMTDAAPDDAVEGDAASAGAAGGANGAEGPDAVDRHVARWSGFLPEMRPAVEEACTRLGRLSGHLQRAESHAVSEGGDHPQDWAMLHALLTLPTPRATPAQLADEFRITRAAVTARIDRLVDRELVTREPDWVDRRRTWVRPTAAGREMWVRHLRAGTLLENEVFGVLDDAELAQLNALLRKVLAPLDP